MAYTDTWNAAFEASPADGDNVSEGAERIRDTKVGIRERLAKDHYFDIAGTDADHGEHVKVTLRTGSAPTNAVDKIFLYAKDVSAKAELFCIDEDGDEVQLTSAGVIAGFPSGTYMLFYQDTAPTGWTIQNSLNDKLIFVTKGSAAGGETGGAAHSTGTWALSGLNTGAVTLTAAQSGVPAHTHPLTIGFRWGGSHTDYPGIYDNGGSGTKIGVTSANTAANAASPHAHTIAAADTWRPAAYCCIIAKKD